MHQTAWGPRVPRPSVRKHLSIQVLDPTGYCTLVSVFVRPCFSVTLHLPPCGPGIGLEPVSREDRLLSLGFPVCNRFPVRTLDPKRYCTLVSVLARQFPSLSLFWFRRNHRFGRLHLPASPTQTRSSNSFSALAIVSNFFYVV